MKETISAESFKIIQDGKDEFDATFALGRENNSWSLFVESGGGGRNRDYRHALKEILERLKNAKAIIQGIYLASHRYENEPVSSLRLDLNFPINLREVEDILELRKIVTRKASWVFGGGNNDERRLKLNFTLPVEVDQDGLLSRLRMPEKRKNWSSAELREAVELYLWMLKREERNEDDVKADAIRNARTLIPDRSYKSIEYRMQNISAVLDELGMDWVKGFKPMRGVGSNVKEELKSILLEKLVSGINSSGDEEGVVGALFEGAKKTVEVNAFERNTKARKLCLEEYGYSCFVCGFNFEEKYGEIGKEYIHVHHLVDISIIGKEYEIDPLEDLRPLCPNCHAMVHKRRPAFLIDELKEIMAQHKRRISEDEPLELDFF